MSRGAVLVTGAGGLVCSEVALALARAGHEVIATDRTFDAGAAARLGALRRIEAPLPGALAALEGFRPAAVIHGAALTSDPGALGMTRAAHLSANLGMTLAALEAARAAGAARFVFVSSMGVFEPDDGPAPGGRMTEAARPTARCPYAAAKRAGEAVVAAAAEPGFATCGLRLGNVLGPHEARRPSRAHLSLAGRMREEAAGGRITARTPGALREWAWLPDLAGGIAAFLGAPWAAPVLHAGAPPACTDAALAAMIAERAGARVAPAAPPHAPVRPPMGTDHPGPLAEIAWTPIGAALDRMTPAAAAP